ncbi:MAG: prepilin-type N-terminal cleavage/methylation domain-containing protein [Planctomycetota bacterium]|nr:prepilin-type N-terminal cleavage/methylation domain-containing protein [Planctomycetota bacterium]
MTELLHRRGCRSNQAGRCRRGFTLVEMIVVMAIIGLLAAILIPTIRAVMVRASESSIAVDLSNLDAALNQFKEKYGDYPPDFSNRNILARHVQKAWPRITTNEMRIFLAIAYHRGGSISGPQWEIDQAEGLVFWLGGFSEDPQHPFTGPGGPFSSGERNPENAYFPFENNRLTESSNIQTYAVEYIDATNTRQTFQFSARVSTDDALLHGLENDPFPVCLTRGTNLPIVYLDAHNYLHSEYPMHGTVYQNTAVSGHAHAYLSDRKLLNGGFEWLNPHSYQLITAGLDEDFGEDVEDAAHNVLFKRYPSGTHYVPGDLDNITNFSGGTLEDAIP